MAIKITHPPMQVSGNSFPCNIVRTPLPLVIDGDAEGALPVTLSESGLWQDMPSFRSNSSVSSVLRGIHTISNSMLRRNGTEPIT